MSTSWIGSQICFYQQRLREQEDSEVKIWLQNLETPHLYDGKTVRSSAPSRKKLAATGSSSSEIPKDAIPSVEIPSFVESLLGGTLVPKMKFLPADKMVQNLQLGCYGVLIALGILTYIVTPSVGTIWFAITGSTSVAGILQLLVIIGAVGTGFWGTMQKMQGSC